VVVYKHCIPTGFRRLENLAKKNKNLDLCSQIQETISHKKAQKAQKKILGS